jgi:hypothetical protein
MKKIISLKTTLIFVASLLVCTAAFGSTPSTYYPKSAISKHLFVIKSSDMSPAESTLVATLQGVTAQQDESQNDSATKNGKPQIYIDREYGGYATWLKYLEEEGQVSHSYVDSPWELLNRYKNDINGYILFEDGDSSINVATSLAGIKNAIAVEASIESEVKSYGLTKLMDVRGKDEAWLKENYWDEFSHDIIFEQKEDFSFQLRDYAAMSKAMMFYDGNSDFRNEVVNSLNDDSVALGWGDASSGEDKFINPSSKAGVFTLPADHASNISVLSGIDQEQLDQKTDNINPDVDPNAHYVTFLMTDGDNIQWLLGDFQSDTRWFGSPHRGSFNMGWGMSPSLVDLAPSVMDWYYENASNDEFKDQFVVGPSAGGYMYPSMYPEQELEQHVEKLNYDMTRADLSLVQVLDFNSFNNIELWDKYTSQPSIDGLFYLEYSRYSKYEGAINWSNGKPVISAREMLWGGLDGTDEQSVIQDINNAAKNPQSSSGYTVVMVHPWSKSLDSVQTVVENLNSDVEVVTPEVLVQLITENVKESN